MQSIKSALFSLFILVVCIAPLNSCNSRPYSGPLVGRWKFFSGKRENSMPPNTVTSVTVGDAQWYILTELEFFPNGTISQDVGTCNFWVEPENILAVECGFGNIGKFNFQLNDTTLAVAGLVFKKV